MDEIEVKKQVREGYAKIATQGKSCCSPISSCCGGSRAEAISKAIGYTDADMSAVPDGANLGLGCGNPVALASLKEGETVLDLGSGGGFDCFLAANRVGDTGKVIGVDMTPEMLDKARANAARDGYKNVEFRLGEIENLPVADASVDAIISNCVINLSPDKKRVFREACRVLKPGGRLMVSDLVLLKPLPEKIRQSIAAYIGCLAGAMMKSDYLGAIEAAGFKDVKVVDEISYLVESVLSDADVRATIENLKLKPDSLKGLMGSVMSIKVQGVKGS